MNLEGRLVAGQASSLTDERIAALKGLFPEAVTEGQSVFKVSDPDREQSFYICLDDSIRLEELRRIELDAETLLVCRDVVLDDETAANLALQCRLKTI